MVENTPDAYHKAFERLIDDDALREKIGRSAYQHAQANWSPQKTEAKFVEIGEKGALRFAGLHEGSSAIVLALIGRRHR